MRAIVLLSPGGRFVSSVLAALHRAGTPVDALVLYDAATRRGGRGVAALPYRLVRDAVRWVLRRVRVLRDPRYAVGARRIVVTGPRNGRGMVRDLGRLRPEVIVLAHCGLVAADVLEIPRNGVLNVHPGLLPWVRGNSPLGNALLRGVPLGATAFRVDAGIDTGGILHRRLLPVAGGESTAELRDALYELWVELTVELVGAAIEDRIPVGYVQEGRFPLCRTLASAEEVEAIEEAVRSGAAGALLDAWAPHCGSDLSLPPDADADIAFHGSS